VARTREQGLTSACLRANGDLRAANEERDEDADEGRGRGARTGVRRGRGRVGGAGTTTSRVSDALDARVSLHYSKTRAVGHEIGFQGQGTSHPYSSVDMKTKRMEWRVNCFKAKGDEKHTKVHLYAVKFLPIQL
jgi:hypothetical protein